MTPFRILPSVKDMAATWMKEGLLIPTGVPGETIKVPYTIENCLQRSDIHLIRDAATNFRGPAITLQAKIAREHIYQSIYQEFLERLRAAVAPVIDIQLGGKLVDPRLDFDIIAFLFLTS
ncbi:hypothetical protein C8R45DRAFT_1098907 [Mycena sanguinolenta]|nr:hypothetical protein C8R45DRAFT_1098907 [Mycena sanguinolenta]